MCNNFFAYKSMEQGFLNALFYTYIRMYIYVFEMSVFRECDTILCTGCRADPLVNFATLQARKHVIPSFSSLLLCINDR